MKGPKIPAGWRRLRKGTVIREGDRFLSSIRDKWIPTSAHYSGGIVGGIHGPDLIYIRRIPRERKR